MIKIFVFDTNCLISAHLLPQSTTRKAFDIAMDEGVLVHSVDTMSEFVQTFTRPKFDKYVEPSLRLESISIFKKKSFLIDVTLEITDCRDPKDNKFLELAVVSEADCIVTGDKDLLILHPFRHIPILTPGDFIQSFQ